MTDKEIIKEYHLKELGKENDRELIKYLRNGEEVPLKTDGS